MKQLTLADITGMSQQNICKLEQSEFIVDETLDKLAKGLGVTVDFIKNFNQKATVNIFSNTFQDNSVANANNCIFNPLEKWLEAMNEIKQLNSALLKEKDEKIALLERLLAK